MMRKKRNGNTLMIVFMICLVIVVSEVAQAFMIYMQDASMKQFKTAINLRYSKVETYRSMIEQNLEALTDKYMRENMEYLLSGDFQLHKTDGYTDTMNNSYVIDLCNAYEDTQKGCKNLIGMGITKNLEIAIKSRMQNMLTKPFGDAVITDIKQNIRTDLQNADTSGTTTVDDSHCIVDWENLADIYHTDAYNSGKMFSYIYITCDGYRFKYGVSIPKVEFLTTVIVRQSKLDGIKLCGVVPLRRIFYFCEVNKI